MIEKSVLFTFVFLFWGGRGGGGWIVGCLGVGWGGKEKEGSILKRRGFLFSDFFLFFLVGGGLWPKIYASSIVR